MAWVLGEHREIPAHCIQGPAVELRALPAALGKSFPDGTCLREMIDLEHRAGYLDHVVDACEPADSPHRMKSGYRGELLQDDGAIDRVFGSLRGGAGRSCSLLGKTRLAWPPACRLPLPCVTYDPAERTCAMPPIMRGSSRSGVAQPRVHVGPSSNASNALRNRGQHLG